MSFWDRFLEEARTLGEHLLEWAILIIAALVVLVIGRWILKWIRKLVERVLGAKAMQPMWDRSGITRALEGSDQTVASITGTIVYAYLMVGLLLIAVRIVRLTTIEDLLTRLLAWLPVLFLAAIIVIISAAVASWVADLIRPFAQEKGVPWLTWLIHIGVILFGALFALDLLNIEFAEDMVKIVVMAAGVGLAIAFGVGGIDTAKLWWAKYGAPNDTQASQGGDDTY